MDRLNTSNGTAVVSCERLVGSPHAGGNDSELALSRLWEVFSSRTCRVLLVVRRQQDAIRSSYQDYVKHGGSAPLAVYLREGKGHARLPGFRREFFEYDRVVRYLFDEFGERQVSVVTFESLVTSPASVLGSALPGLANRPSPAIDTKISHTPENPSGSILATRLDRMSNATIGRSRLSPGAPFGSPWLLRRTRAVTSKISELIPKGLQQRSDKRLAEVVETLVPARSFSESNKRLALLADVDLRTWDYP